MNLTEFRKTVSPRAIAVNWTEAQNNVRPYVGSQLFPAQKKAGLDLAWFKGSKGLPVTLKPSTFDAKATFRDRIGVGKLETEMPFFREGFKIKEKDRQEILRAQDTNDPYAQSIIATVFDDARNLIDGANVVPERQIMQLLFAENGNMGIAITANGVDYTYNYDPNGAWKQKNYFPLTGNATWNNTTTADPFEDIDAAKKAISDHGGKAAYLVMNTTTLRLLRKIDAVKNRFLTVNGMAFGYLRDVDVVNVVKETEDLLGIIVYDNQFVDEDGNTQQFVPDNYVAVIPDGALGNTWYGTTPEEADLMGSDAAEVAIVNTGVAVTQILDPHPVNLNTFASEIVLPSFERMDEVALIKVV